MDEPELPDDGKRSQTRLIVEVIQRKTVEVDVFLPMDETWKRREELAQPFLKDEAGEPLWTPVTYRVEAKP